MFGIDQNPFMQGYMPVWLLTTMAHTEQNLQNAFIKTGPSFVEEAPSNALKSCTANNFQVCALPVKTDLDVEADETELDVEAAAVIAGRSIVLFLVPFLFVLLE